MEITTLIVLFRGGERLIMILAAILSLYFGYRLFVLGIVDAQSGSVEANGFKLSLAHTGPGIFFALFGTITLTMLANAQLTVQLP